MIKRTLFFGNPYYLKTKDEQLIIVSKQIETEVSEPIEDLGFIVLDHPQITVSYSAIQKLVKHNVAVLYCDEKHLPSSMLLSLNSHYAQNERFRQQLEASEPLKKQLWKQTIIAKIRNEAQLIEQTGGNAQPLFRWSAIVKSGDSDNLEAIAAKYYWSELFEPYLDFFTRERYGESPNNLLNYGYALLRAATARALAGVGLLCTLGIHHHNRYNAFCLADDLMEPYRPFVDAIVLELLRESKETELTIERKRRLLQIFTEDTQMSRGKSPLMIALNQTAHSLVNCFAGTHKKLAFPSIPNT